MDAFWRDLYQAQADLAINGHDHDYQRFAQQNPDAQKDSDGIREFVVGTGGAETDTIHAAPPNVENYQDQRIRFRSSGSGPRATAGTSCQSMGSTWADPGETPTYTVYTGPGPGSTATPTPTPTPPAQTSVFADDFESQPNQLAAWSKATAGDGTAVVQDPTSMEEPTPRRCPSRPRRDPWRISEWDLGATYPEATATAWFNVQAEGAAGGSAPLLGSTIGANNPVLTVFRWNLLADMVGFSVGPFTCRPWTTASSFLAFGTRATRRECDGQHDRDRS